MAYQRVPYDCNSIAPQGSTWPSVGIGTACFLEFIIDAIFFSNIYFFLFTVILGFIGLSIVSIYFWIQTIKETTDELKTKYKDYKKKKLNLNKK